MVEVMGLAVIMVMVDIMVDIIPNIHIIPHIIQTIIESIIIIHIVRHIIGHIIHITVYTIKVGKLLKLLNIIDKTNSIFHIIGYGGYGYGYY